MGKMARRIGFVLAAGTVWLALVPGPSFAQQQNPQRDPEKEYDIDRLDVSAYVGDIIDTFASSASQQYTNKEDASGSGSGVIGGINFTYRLSRNPKAKGDGLEIYGKTVHSTRTLETPCTGTTACPDQFFEILKEASTVEWYGGMRYWWHLPRLNKDDPLKIRCEKAPATWSAAAKEDGCPVYETAFYVAAEAGFIRAKGANDDVIDNHFIGVGVEHLVGPYRGSYLQIGWGRTDLYEPDKRSRRFKAGGVLKFRPPKKADAKPGVVGFFLAGALDSDLGPGSDSVLTSFGISFDIDQLTRNVWEPQGGKSAAGGSSQPSGTNPE